MLLFESKVNDLTDCLQGIKNVVDLQQNENLSLKLKDEQFILHY